LYQGLSQRWQSDLQVLNVRPRPTLECFADLVEYKDLMTGTDGKISSGGTFIGTSFISRVDRCRADEIAGLGAGATEAVLVVSPMEVIKIRLQAQQRM
jgi:solute carrier family 25 citrate transporter 1